VADGDDGGDVFGARAVAVLLAAPTQEGLKAGALFEIEGADAFRGVEFVAAK